TTLNLTYGSASYVYEEMNLDSIQVQIPVTDGMVSFADVQQAYEILLAGIKAQYHGLNAESKQFIYCNLKPSENQLKNGSETWELVSGVGAGPVNLFNFGPNDYWIWWNDDPTQSGICGGPLYPSSTIGLGSDAAKEIKRKVLLRKPVVQGNYRYINPVDVPADPWNYPNPNQTQINMYSAFLFENTSGFPNYHLCLCPDEMNFYLYGAERIVYNHPPIGARPDGLNFVTIDIHGDLGLLPGNVSYPCHRAIITYAELIQYPEPPLEF
ncbi:MAG: hypothetical protein GX459_13585, partial [Bacteroidales bacterium]|nr:hypothetical protein [Bacteroidales bacterium]